MAEQQDLVVAMSCSNLEIWRFKNVEIYRTGTLEVRRIALLAVGRKVVKKNFFLTWQKNRENVVEKCGEVIEKKLVKK